MDEFEVIAGFLPPFLSKTYNMVDESSTDSIVSWSSGNKSFIVWNPPEFARDLLPKYFKHNNFSSFIRQLNTYGFRKIDSEKWEFANDDFVRGQPQLMKNIHRQKPVHSHSLPNIQVQAAEGSYSSLSEGERKSMKDEIERLNLEKERLAVELERHEQERQGMELQMRFLEDRVQHMQRQQQSLVALLARVLQRPELASNPVPQLELRDRKRRFSSVGRAYDDVIIGNGQMGSTRENMEMGKVLQLESFVRFWEDAILDIGDTDLQARKNLELAESTSFVEIDMNLEPAAAARSVSTEPARTRSVPLEPARSVSFDPARSVSSEPARSASLEPARSVSLEPPRRFSPEPARSVSLELDIRVSLEPAKSVSSETHVSKQTSKEQTAKLSGAGVNDVFWEQFLTEIPGSNESQEVQLERKDSDDRGNKSNISERSKSWLNMRNVNNLTEQMGHLSSVEKT